MRFLKKLLETPPELHLYHCNHCHQNVRRDSQKRWITSYCEQSGENVRLWRVQ